MRSLSAGPPAGRMLPVVDAANPTIERLDGTAAAAAADELAALLCDAVDGGASVGYLPPLDRAVARAWADDVAAEVAAGRTILLAARRSGRLCGSVQLQRASSPNGAHRAEVAKLLVQRAARRRARARG